MDGWKKGLSPILGDFELKNGTYFIWQSNQNERFARNFPENAGMGGKRAQVTGGGGGGGGLCIRSSRQSGTLLKLPGEQGNEIRHLSPVVFRLVTNLPIMLFSHTHSQFNLILFVNMSVDV